MIKVIEGHKVKRGANMQPIFLKFRSNALQYPGFIGAENLMSKTNASVILFISIWKEVENWVAWQTSTTRTELYQQAKELIADEPKVNIYEIVPTHW